MPAILKDYARMLTVSVVLFLVLGGIGIGIGRANTINVVEPIAAQAVDTTRQDLLIDTEWLRNRLNAPDARPIIIDVSDAEQYAREHIPGAIHVWWQDTMNLNGAGYGEAFSLSAPSPYRPNLGATQDDIIVVYDNAASEHASHLVWQLRSSGYTRAVVLDGGLAAWNGAGESVTSTSSIAQDVEAPQEMWLPENEVTTQELSGQVNDPNLMIIDTRSDSQKQDTVNDTIRTGQIPGSISLPAGSVMREDGTFVSADESAKKFESLGLSPDDDIVVYARFGTESGQIWLALRVAGYENVRVYDDGWLAWSYDESLPIEPVSRNFRSFSIQALHSVRSGCT